MLSPVIEYIISNDIDLKKRLYGFFTTRRHRRIQQ